MVDPTSAFDSAQLQSLVENAIDFHCHGIGRFDFTEIMDLNLHEIEDILSARKQHAVLTLYLPKSNFHDFIHLLDSFHLAKKRRKFIYLLGFALEGPLLASHGGTPEKGVWLPSKHHWKEIAACGKKGLVYTVLSPDAQLLGSNFNFDRSSPSIEWITKTLLDGGVLPAPGHFIKSNPIESAKLLQEIFDVVNTWGRMPIITDHLFNDMPRNFKHAWRTKEERLNREREIKDLNLESWNLSNLKEKLGPVPGVIIQNALKGLVKICLNFDGEHVDLAIIKKIIELVGAENIIMMTDSIESKRLAGRPLHVIEDSTLLYQDEGIVAAGSQNIFHQISNMVSMGLSVDQIEQITNNVPIKILRQRNNYIVGLINDKVDSF